MQAAGLRSESLETMHINTELNTALGSLRCLADDESEQHYCALAAAYAEAEQAIAVLSNLRRGVSHIYYGSVGERLGIATGGEYHLVDSIWEEEILSRIHPDDLQRKQVFELQFLYFQRTQTPLEWRMEHVLRMHDDEGNYRKLLHRIQYFCDGANEAIDYALCLYSFACEDFSGGRMVCMATGERRRLEDQDYSRLLSQREKEVLRLISEGRLSKEIADRLCISVNTVNRHRQNILQHLHVSNSMEACRIAEELGLL